METRVKTLERPYVALFPKTGKGLGDVIESPYRFVDSSADEKVPLTSLGVRMSPHTPNVHVAYEIQNMRRWVGRVEGVTYAYDLSGNLTSAGSNTYTWDYRNRMTDSVVGSASSHYTYDANDQRTQMDVNSGSGTTSTKYWNRYYETSGATSTTYIWAGDQLLAMVEGDGTATTTNVVHTDHLGGTNVTSDATGTLAQLNTYYPFGSIRQNENDGTLDTKRKYIGQQYDDSTSLSYLNARYYEGSRGQFLSQDPVARDIGIMKKQSEYILAFNAQNGDIDQNAVLTNPQLLNTYSYAVDNPVSKRDPSGKCLPECAPALIGGAIGGIGAPLALYISGVYQNAQVPGATWGQVLKSNNSAKDYAKSSVTGAATGATAAYSLLAAGVVNIAGSLWEGADFVQSGINGILTVVTGGIFKGGAGVSPIENALQGGNKTITASLLKQEVRYGATQESFQNSTNIVVPQGGQSEIHNKSKSNN